MKNLFTTLVIVLALGLLGCATSSKKDADQPDWVTGQSSKYERQRYLVGRGQGGDLDMAKDRARADLAKNFDVQVTERTEDIQQFEATKDGEAATSRLEESASRKLTTHTDQLLQGAEIAELWQDPETKTFYALAVLSRTKASRGLRKEIQGLDEATRHSVRSAQASDDPLVKVAFASRALATQTERERLEKTLRVVDRLGHGVPSDQNAASLRVDRDELLQRIQIVARGSERGYDHTEDLVGSALVSAGFAGGDDNEPDYELKGLLLFDEPRIREGVHWVVGTLEITLLSAKSQQARGTKRWELKAGSSVGPSVAQRRAIEKAQAVLNAQLRSTILGFAGE